MSELTPEERERIYEEEKARHDAQQKLKKEEENKNTTVGCFGFIIIVALIALLISCCDGGDKSSSTPKPPDKFDAYVMSQLFVEDELKSPSSADFPVYSEEMVKAGAEQTFLVTSYVDAQNSFGVTIRNNYACLMQYDKATDEWVLKELVIN